MDYLKIDGIFVRGILRDDVDLAMVRASNDVEQFKGKRTIAEFLETDAIRQRLRDMGLDYVQGPGVVVPPLLIV